MPLIAGLPDILATPVAPSAVQNATGTGASINYSIVYVDAYGQDSLPSVPVTVTNNNATPNNTINWVLAPGVVQCRILKNSNVLATVGPGVTTYTDSAGSTGATYTPAVCNPLDPSLVASMPIDSVKWTYSASKNGIVPGTSATDIFTITGSASKIIRVLYVEIWATSTAATAAAIDVLLIKRNVADTGGTTTGSPTPTPHDINAPAVSATVLIYTSTPPTATGAQGTAIRSAKLIPALATYTATDFPVPVPLIWYFGNRPGQGIVLRGIADVLAVNLNGVTPPAGPLFNISMEWTEE